MTADDRREHIERTHFDRLAADTGGVWWGSATPAAVERLRRRARLLVEALGRYGDPRVLELGCGTGAFSERILEVLPALRLEAFDISPKCVAIPRSRLAGYANASFNTGNALDVQYSDHSFDAVVGNSVLHHLPLEKALAEA